MEANSVWTVEEKKVWTFWQVKKKVKKIWLINLVKLCINWQKSDVN